MTSLLPSTAHSFKQLGYWDQFYSRRSVPFEWYGEYADVEQALHRYLRPKDKVLQIGCGNSTLAEELHDNGIQDITSIDVVESVVTEQMQKAAVSNRTGLKYDVMDAAKLSFPSTSFTAVLDKGTLDALLPLNPHEEGSSFSEGQEGSFVPDGQGQSRPLTSEEDDGNSNVGEMFNEVYRVLNLCGRYIVISLAQEHVVRRWLDYFTKKNCLIRIHVVPKLSYEEFALPVFLLVITKLRDGVGDAEAQSFEIAETSNDSLAVQKLANAEDVVLKVKDIQTYCLLCKHLRENRIDGEIALTLSLSKSDKETDKVFDVRILDVELKRPTGPYAVFVTPIGREQEYHFGDKDGRLELAHQVNHSRLAVLRLSSYNHGYQSVDQVRHDLGTRILDFAPGLCYRRNFQVPFLSATTDLSGAICTVFAQTSPVNGPISVVDVWADEAVGFRRLVFMRHQGIVQSEARIVKKKASGKKRAKAFKTTVNTTELTCGHHQVMVSQMENYFKDGNASSLHTLILGLGGGLLATVIASHRFVSKTDAVELDPIVIQVAKDCFQLDQNVELHVGCAAEAVAKWNEENHRFDCIMVDVAGSAYEDGIAAPVPALLTQDFVENLAGCLADGGLLLINAITRRTEKLQSIKDLFSAAFDVIEIVSLPDEVNRVLVLKQKVLKQTS